MLHNEEHFPSTIHDDLCGEMYLNKNILRTQLIYTPRVMFTGATFGRKYTYKHWCFFFTHAVA
jgi:hypothetical protein